MNTATDNLETGIYLIDHSRRIVYLNQALQQLFPEVHCGDLCYQAICSEDFPCPNCPLALDQKDTSIFYNQKLRRWIEVNTAWMDWPGVGPCRAVVINQIQARNRHLFLNLTGMSVYDELFELNVTQNTYTTLYRPNHKYCSLSAAGTLTAALKDTAQRLVHPDDRQAFLSFWDLNQIFYKIAAPPFPGLFRGEFRRKLASGQWCWVLETVVPLTVSQEGDQTLLCFVQDISEQKAKQLKQTPQPSSPAVPPPALDPLTGLYQKLDFLRLAADLLQRSSQITYCLMAIDIEHFKLFNEWYGHRAGDRFLRAISQLLDQAQALHGGVAGYMGNDDFAILLPNRPELLAQVQNEITLCSKRHGGNAGFLPAFGLYAVQDAAAPVITMYDRACIALTEVIGNYAQRAKWYDTKIVQVMEENHVLLSEVQHALEHGEFTFYAQPQCHMSTGKIVGFESLVRWVHPTRGLITPNDFVPLLERSGFIVDLDVFIWNQVCRNVRRWIDQGHRPIPISVNVSRVDIYTMDVVRHFRTLVRDYHLDPALIEIEITESAYAEDCNIITSVVNELRQAGFTILMDDFGSGYSSLNMLKDVNVDILKIDMKFLDMNEQSKGRGTGILQAIISMARLMELRIIAEGVETQEQLELLQDLDCWYGQGYYFYHPMPIAAVEALLADEEKIDFGGIQAQMVEQLSPRELLNQELFSETLLNNILGAVAFYGICQGVVEIIRANEQYYRLTQTNPADLEARRTRILEYVYHEDHQIALDIFERAHRNILKGAQGEFRRHRGDGATIWMHLRVFFLREQDGHRLFYGSVSDITQQKQLSEQLAAAQLALASLAPESERPPASPLTKV